MASSSPPAGATMPPSLSPALKELHTNILDLIRSVTPAAGPTGSFLLMDDSESDADAVPLDGLWSQALTLASTTLDPSTDLPLLPLVLAQCVSHAALPPNYALDPHFYLLAATLTDLDAAHTVLSLMDLPAAVNNPGVLLPDAWVPLWPRMVVDVVLRSARWHRLPVDADAVTMEMPLLVLAFATARMARLSDPACYVDDATIRQLLTALHASRTHHHLEPLHDALAQLLLAINDQSLAWPLPPLDPDAGPPLPMNTPLLRAICHSPPTSSSSPTSPACTPPPTSSPSSARPALSSPAAHSFTETLVFLLNRAAHAANQLLVLKPVYVILAVRPDLFYTNDVRVLIQVVLRVLLDDECTPSVRNALLRVLEVGVPNVKRVGMGEEVKRVVGCVGEWVRVGKVRDDVGGTTGRVAARVLDVLGEE